MASGNFVNKNHAVGLSQWHFEWCPKYRYKCMRKEHINKEVELLIGQAAEEHGIVVHTIAVGIDHVHVFASIPFSMSPSMALMLLKGRSAYLIFRKFSGFRKRYPRGHFWSPGKFVRSISNVTSGAIKGYIENQQFDKLHETVRNVAYEPAQLNLANFF
jgi:putative transposase